MASAEVIQYNLKFTLSEDQTFYSVKKADGVEIGYELRIPAEIEGLPVKEIETEAFAGDTSINIVIIPDSVITIGDRAFKDCTSLQGIVIPRTVENYGYKIFENVPKTFRILHSEFETSILSEDDDRLAFTLSSDGTFYYVKPANYYISGDIEIPEEYNGLPVKTIDRWSFAYCSASSITIPDSVTSIGERAFHCCAELTSVIIGNSVTSIGSYAFYGCTSLTSIIVDSDNTVYKSNGNCLIEKTTNTLIAGFKTSIIPNDVTSIGESAFDNCTSLTSITIPDSVTSIGGSAFNYCTGLTSVTIGNGVTSIGQGAFSNCSTLTEITIPDSVTSIGYQVFYNCNALTSITIPDSVTSIESQTFSYCSALTSVTIPDSVTTIDRYAFQNCTSLKTAILGKGLKTLYGISNYINGSFSGCTALTTVINKSDNFVTPDNANVFYNCPKLTKVYYTSTTAGYTEGGTWCGRTLERLVPPEQVIQDGLIYTLSDDGTYYSVKAENTSITTANILSEISWTPVTEIGISAFESCTSLTSITIPDGVTSIGAYAFRDCTALKTVILGKGLKTLYGTPNYNGSFVACTALTTVINKSDNFVTPNNSYPFYGSNKLTKVYFTSTDAGYVDGGTWCDRTLVYLDWDGQNNLVLDAEVTKITLTNTNITVTGNATQQ